MVLVPVDDLDDERLADYLHLREPSRRMQVERDRGIFTVEGRLSLEALIASPYELVSVLVNDDQLERVAPLVEGAVPLYALPSREIEQLTGVHFHRGVLAVARRPPDRQVADVVAGAGTLLVLESVNDHENIGALFRNAAAFGVGAVVLDPTSSDPLYRRSTRVSLGHVLRVPFARVGAGDWPGAVDDLRALGFTTVALTPAVDAEPLRALVSDPPERVALLLGAEGDGLSSHWLQEADRAVCIPMSRSAMGAGVDSLNVVAAAAIACHGLMRSAG
jgi:tRNA G18 (ribose-2'-O)-methylase SpoU